MITTVAVDDEPLALDLINTFCNRFDFLQFERGFTNTSAAQMYFQKNPVDLLFLDINMPAISGFDFYRSLSQKPMLIFTTSYSEFALESYELNAVDYLLKPFTPARFESAIKKVKERYDLLNQSAEKETEKFLMLKADNGITRIVLSKVLFIEGLDNYLKIHLEGQAPVVVRMTLKLLTEKLNEREFVRVHRSYIVPVNRIQSMKNKVIIVAGEIIPVGQNYEENVKISLSRIR